MLTELKIRWRQFWVNRTRQYEFIAPSRTHGKFRGRSDIVEQFTKEWLDERPKSVVDVSASFKDLNRLRQDLGDLPSTEEIQTQVDGLSADRRRELDEQWLRDQESDVQRQFNFFRLGS